MFQVVDKNLAVADLAGAGRFFDCFDRLVDDGVVHRVIEAIEASARTGKIGDGKIFVSTLEQVVRIRTGETGRDAL